MRRRHSRNVREHWRLCWQTRSVRKWLRRNGLSIVVITTFLLIWLIGQTSAGLRIFNAERRQDGLHELSMLRYITTSHFGEATFENWESEFLQMGMYVVLTVKLRQRGSSESKPLDGPSPQDEDPNSHRDDPAAPWPVQRGGPWLAVYRNSLSLAFIALFLAAFLLHALTGSRAFNHEQAASATPDHVSTWGTSSERSSGSSRCRTGSPSSSRSPPSSCFRSSFDNTAHPNPNPSTPRTPPPAKAEQLVPPSIRHAEPFGLEMRSVSVRTKLSLVQVGGS